MKPPLGTATLVHLESVTKGHELQATAVKKIRD